MSAENAVIEYESFATLHNWAKLADSGDHQVFNSSSELWSAQEDKKPQVRPDGVILGGKIEPAGAQDKVNVSAAKVYQGGKEVNVLAAAGLTVTRGVTDSCVVNSVIVNASGAYAIVVGDEGTALSEVRGAAGGPPWIPTGAIEIGQIRLTSKTGAVVSADEILQGENVHIEMAVIPVYEVRYVTAENGVLGLAGVTFKAQLPVIHSDDDGVTTKTKEVWAKWYEPEFIQVDAATGFGASEKTYSVQSNQVYGGVKTSIAASIGQGQFTVYLQDGISDNFLRAKDTTRMVKFLPDRNNPGVFRMEIGKIGVKRTWPASGDITAACTLSPITEGVEVYE
ncbi:MAG: hypothetical protein AB1457_16290 [Chloroflexota bacterium]